MPREVIYDTPPIDDFTPTKLGLLMVPMCIFMLIIMAGMLHGAADFYFYLFAILVGGRGSIQGFRVYREWSRTVRRYEF